MIDVKFKNKEQRFSSHLFLFWMYIRVFYSYINKLGPI